MDEYLQSTDVHLLRSHGFVVGCFGESWFGADKEGHEWQAYVVTGDDRLTFVGPDRISQYMKREDFIQNFSKE